MPVSVKKKGHRRRKSTGNESSTLPPNVSSEVVASSSWPMANTEITGPYSSQDDISVNINMNNVNMGMSMTMHNMNNIAMNMYHPMNGHISGHSMRIIDIEQSGRIAVLSQRAELNTYDVADANIGADCKGHDVLTYMNVPPSGAEDDVDEDSDLDLDVSAAVGMSAEDVESVDQVLFIVLCCSPMVLCKILRTFLFLKSRML